VKTLNWFIEQLNTLLNKEILVSPEGSITVAVVVTLFFSMVLLWFVTGRTKKFIINSFFVESTRNQDDLFTNIFRWVFFLVGTILVANALNIDNATHQIIASMRNLLNAPLLEMGKTSLTLWSVVYIAFLFTILIMLVNKMQNWIANSLLSRANLETGLRHATAAILKYIVVCVGFIVILQSAGLDLSALTVFAGAVGLGLSFGLQNITSNLVSGLIVLFERPIKVGDRIEVGGIVGEVSKIALRATVIKTNDNIEIIVPNSEFISHNVTNWSHSDRYIRIGIPVGVSYNSDPEQVNEILLEAASEHPGVLDNHQSMVIFEGFGDSSINFVLRVFTKDYVDKPGILRSDLNYSIFKKLKANKIEIPFPQRDIHIRKATNI